MDDGRWKAMRDGRVMMMVRKRRRRGGGYAGLMVSLAGEEEGEEEGEDGSGRSEKEEECAEEEGEQKDPRPLESLLGRFGGSLLAVPRASWGVLGLGCL